MVYFIVIIQSVLSGIIERMTISEQVQKNFKQELRVTVCCLQTWRDD